MGNLNLSRFYNLNTFLQSRRIFNADWVFNESNVIESNWISCRCDLSSHRVIWSVSIVCGFRYHIRKSMHVSFLMYLIEIFHFIDIKTNSSATLSVLYVYKIKRNKNHTKLRQLNESLFDYRARFLWSDRTVMLCIIQYSINRVLPYIKVQ